MVCNSRICLLWISLLALSTCMMTPAVPRRMWGWDRPFTPYQVIGNIYYVGTSEVAQFLIVTPAGHILIDSGFEAGVPRLRENVEKLGYRFEDIKILLSSHAHIDHVQAHATVRRLTGAKVVASAKDAVFLASGGKGETVFDGIDSWPPCPVDRQVADGDEVLLGGTALVAHLTPGHTRGATTWTMRVTDAARTLDVVFFPSANINPGVRLVGNPRYPEIVADFEHSFATWKALPCDVFLADHGDFYAMKDKFDRLKHGEKTNPFIDPDGYKRFVARAEKTFREELASEQ